MIIFYSKTGCPWGDEVRDLLNDKGVAFEERDMIKNPAFRQECEEKTGQSKCPTLDIDGHILADSDAKQVEEYLASLELKA
jgi:glutaredoxin